MLSTLAFNESNRRGGDSCFKIHPGPWDSPIKCELQHVSLNEKPSYEALSYVWGDTRDVRQIILGGHVWSVTANLATALQYLRYEDKLRIMWIDALCINQSDLKERSEQVPKMWEIYRSASNVVCWLGPPNQETSTAMDEIEEIVTKFDRVSVDEQFFLQSLSPEACLQAGLDTSTINWPAILSIFERPYWAWVVQELATCRLNSEQRGTVVCGHKSISKKRIDLILFLFSKAELFIIQGQPAEPVRSLSLRGVPPALRMWMIALQYVDETDDAEPRSLDRLIKNGTSNLKCSDPRDKIYSVLGLARKQDLAIAQPDYSKPVDCVFTDFVKGLIQRDHSLECLLFNRAETNNDGPSWVSYMYGVCPSGPLWADEERRYRAAGGFECDTNFYLDGQSSLLVVKGVRVGVVETKVGPLKGSREAGQVSGADLRQENIVEFQRLNQFARTLTDREQHECLWKTVVMDADISDLENIVHPAPQLLRQGYAVSMGFEPAPGDFQPDLPQEQRADQFIKSSGFGHNFSHAMMSRCLFRTLCGKMGLGPYHTKPGDVVAALFGANYSISCSSPKGAKL